MKGDEPALGNPVVLVTDDDPVVRILARGALEPSGFAVIDAGDDEEAFDPFAWERPTDRPDGQLGVGSVDGGDELYAETTEVAKSVDSDAADPSEAWSRYAKLWDESEADFLLEDALAVVEESKEGAGRGVDVRGAPADHAPQCSNRAGGGRGLARRAISKLEYRSTKRIRTTETPMPHAKPQTD